MKQQGKEQVFDNIQKLKKLLNKSDYKIIKSYELFLLNKESSYDIESLHKERQQIRDEINKQQELLNTLLDEI